MGKKSCVKGKNFIIMFFLLLSFWVVIHGGVTVESLFIGGIAAIIILYFNKDLIFSSKDGGPITFGFLWKYIRLIGVLIIEVFKSNIQVAKIVLSPKMPIHPSFVKVPVRLKKDFNKVLYGNIVTLTPGTLTVDITEKNEYVIHSLTKEAAEGLYDSVLENHVLRLEVKDE